MPGDGVVLAFDHLKGGMGAVGLQISLTTPHRHDAVTVAVKEEHWTLVRSRSAKDVELLGGDEIFSTQLIETSTADVLRRILGVEGGIEKLAALTGLLDHRAWSNQHHA